MSMTYEYERVGFERFGRLVLALQRSSLSRNAKAALAAIVSLVDWTTWYRQFPTRWVAMRVGVSEDTVARALPELVALGLLERVEPPASSPCWQVYPEAILELEPVPLKRDALPASSRGPLKASSGGVGGRALPPATEARRAPVQVQAATPEVGIAAIRVQTTGGRARAAGGLSQAAEPMLGAADVQRQAAEPVVGAAGVQAQPAVGRAQAAGTLVGAADVQAQIAPGWPQNDRQVNPPAHALSPQDAGPVAQNRGAPPQIAAPFLQEERSQPSPSLDAGRIAGSQGGSIPGFRDPSGALEDGVLPAPPALAGRPASTATHESRRAAAGGIDANGEGGPLSPDARRFLQVLHRWAGPEAPEGAGWRIQPKNDLEWYQRELVAGGLADGLNMLEVLSSWDEFLELIVRGQKRCRFPTNFKNSLRNQLAMWRQRQAQGRSDRLAPKAARSADSVSGAGATPEPAAGAPARSRIAPGVTSSPAGVPARRARAARDETGARFPTREQWHTEPDGSRKTSSYTEHVARAQRTGGKVWSRAEFDACIREAGLEPVD